MKYRLIKKYPGSKPIGTFVIGSNAVLYKWRNGDKFCGNVGCDPSKYPKYFAPYRFTTEDGVELFKGDSFWVASKNQNTITSLVLKKWQPDSNSKAFSTKEAAKKWLEEQKKPQFEVGEWLYYSYTGMSYSYKFLFRFNGICEISSYIISNELYEISSDGRVQISIDKDAKVTNYKNATKATPEQIESVLTKVAEHKGFKEGVKFKSAVSKYIYPVYNQGLMWDTKYNYGLYPKESPNTIGSGCIYYNGGETGKWAEIITEPKLTLEEVYKAIESNPEIEKLIRNANKDGNEKNK